MVEVMTFNKKKNQEIFQILKTKDPYNIVQF